MCSFADKTDDYFAQQLLSYTISQTSKANGNRTKVSSVIIFFLLNTRLNGSALLIKKSSRCNILNCFITELQILLDVGSVRDAEPDDWCGDENGNGTDTELRVW